MIEDHTSIIINNNTQNLNKTLANVWFEACGRPPPQPVCPAYCQKPCDKICPKKQWLERLDILFCVPLYGSESQSNEHERIISDILSHFRKFIQKNSVHISLLRQDCRPWGFTFHEGFALVEDKKIEHIQRIRNNFYAEKSMKNAYEEMDRHTLQQYSHP